jgi:DDE superfamily endonuclease
MPRHTNKSLLESELSSLIEDELIRSLLEPALLDDDIYHFHLHDLVTLADNLANSRYLIPRSVGSAGRLPIDDTITEFLNFPESSFLVNFRMKPESFWALVELLEQRGGEDYWHQRSVGTVGGGTGRPVFQQVAAALYVLGSAGTSLERTRMTLNIGKGTIQSYLWRTVNLLAVLSREYIRWPAADLRRQQRAQQANDVFGNCVGYLDGSEIPLRDRPLKDPEAYFSRKKVYGFNLQAICNQKGEFTYAYAGCTASTHDSTAFKASSFYQQRQELMNNDEYILTDKAYQLDKHIITPYKQPIARQPSYKAFNKAHSKQRIRIEHAFGVLKARWSSLRSLPIRIRDDVQKDHTRVIRWTMACLVLHNFLSLRGEDDDWLEATIEDEEGSDHVSIEPQSDTNSSMREIGENRRDSLREKLQEESLFV